MKSYSVSFVFEKIKKIPKIHIVIWSVLFLIFISCTYQIFVPKYKILDKAYDCEINIESVSLYDSHDTKGDRMKLKIICEETTYYVWYPQSKYLDYEPYIVNDLLSGNVTSVKAKVVDDRTIRDRLFDEKCIVDLRSDSAVYYDIETEKTELDEEYISLWVVFFLVFIVLLCDTAITLLVYDVIAFKKRRRK